MTKKARSILFILFAVLFLSVAPLIIFYCQGYRFDFEAKKITQTGGFFLKISPKGASVFLNDEFQEKTDLFFGSVLIDNLLPKKYNLRVEKENYHTWEKNLEAEAKKVTEVKNILLVFKDPKFKKISENVKSIWPSPSKKKFILEESLSLKIFEGSVKSSLIDEKELSKKIEADITDISWSFDENRVLIKTEDLSWFLLDIDNKRLDLIEGEYVFFGPRNELLTAKKNKQGYLDVYNDSELMFSNVITYESAENSVLWLSENGIVFQSDPSNENHKQINQKKFKVKDNIQYQIKKDKSLTLLIEENNYYLFSEETKGFEKIADKANDIKISPDYKKMAYLRDHELWILFLKDIEEQPQRKQGERILLARFSEKIGQLFWINNYYLLFTNSQGKLIINEIDNRDKVNIVDLASFNSPKIFWDSIKKKLYLLTEEEFSFTVIF